MRNKIDEYLVNSFYGEYKSGVFSKKKTVSVLVYSRHVEGRGVSFYEDKIYEKEFHVEINKIREVKIEEIEGYSCLVIEFLDVHIIGNQVNTVAFPNLQSSNEVIAKIQELKESLITETQRKEEIRKKQEEERLLLQKRKTEERELFFEQSYNFHILENSNPFYELHRDNLQFACIYIDKNKNLNFLKIDGVAMTENNAVITLDKLHYYEKAGEVHYTTEINGEYKNFGGRIDGATFSKEATFLGGLLFGTMGLAAGALYSYKPATVTIPSTRLNVSSEVKKIDDRSVILNYYSDVKNQFMDIELPMDIYNFLQTYLPEKKYGIVLEIEKQEALKKYAMLSDTNIQEESMVEKSNTMSDDEIFQNKLRKLKMMYDSGVLSEEEYVNEKTKMLSQL